MTRGQFTLKHRTRRSATPIVASLVMLAVGLPLSPRTANADDAKRTGAEWVREGNKLLQAKKYDKALNAYDHAQQVLPKSAKIAYNRGIALYELGRYDEAETALQNALKPDAADLEADAKYNLGRCAQGAAMSSEGDPKAALNQTKRAVSFYKDALAIRPNDPDTKKNLAIAQTQQKFLEKLIELAKKMQQKAPQQQKNSDQQNDQKKNEDQQKNENQSQQKKGDQQKQSQSQSGKGKKKDQQQGQDSKEGKKSKKQKQGQSKKPSEEKKQSEASKSQKSNEAQGQQDQRTDKQLGEDQLKEALAQLAKNQKKDAEKQKNGQKNGKTGDRKDKQQMIADTTSQPTTMPAETPLEKAKRISIDKANRLLQQARDKEARRREALRQARLRRLGRADVDKDW